jgi:hypothetical protein
MIMILPILAATLVVMEAENENKKKRSQHVN